MVLARWQGTITDGAGNVIDEPNIEVRREVGGTPLAALFSDRDGLVPLGNPFIGGSDGYAGFHVAGGAYRIRAYKGAFERIWRYVPIGLAAETDLQTGVIGPDGGVADDELVLFDGATGVVIKGSGTQRADVLKRNAAANLTAGYTATPFDAGTKAAGTFTPDPANGNFQAAINGGAHTLAPPAASCTMVIQYTNNASAGEIATAGFTLVDGDDITDGNGDRFFFYITRVGAFSYLNVKALP